MVACSGKLLKFVETIVGFVESQVKSHVKIFPKVSHGWTVRYSVEDEAACKSAEEAHQDLLKWFLNHVK